MVKDARLDLGRYVSNPFNRRGQITKRLDFGDLFTSRAAEGEYPWNPSRFETIDLIKKAQSRKPTLNPDLKFIGTSPFFDSQPAEEIVKNKYELFEGLGRFERPFDYDFREGRPLTKKRPEQQPDFNPEWVEAYHLSPTVNPEGISKNPMPRMKNPDPKGFLMAIAEGRAEAEKDGDVSVSQLLDRGNKLVKEQKMAEEKQGERTVKEVENSPDKIETKEKPA
tara:strand:+ start:221 stop:889 length:669 start_codon:yes stop_codon:yes gene_type:complete